MGARLQNRYELGEPEEALEAGVWHRGEDVRSRRAVRIAVLSADASAERIAAFERVARLAPRVRHPGVERVVSSGRDDDGRPYIVVEHPKGQLLGERLLADPIVKLHELLRSVTSVLNGLDIAHKAGLVHGGIEPLRLLVDDKLRAQLGGFALHGASGSMPAKDLVAWLAPEVLAGAAPTAASDVYGMGAILYRAFVGEAPKIGAGLSLRERRRVIPASLAEAVDKAIAVEPSDRPQSAGDLRKELTAAMVGAQGLRTMVVPRAAERADDTLETTEHLSLADLEEPSARELVAWTKKSSSTPPPIPRRRPEPNRRALAAAKSRPSPWKRSDPPPLLSPANTISNERIYRPPAPARRAPSPIPSGSARAARTGPAVAPTTPTKPAVKLAKVKLVPAVVPRRARKPQIVEIDSLTDIVSIEDLEPVEADAVEQSHAEPDPAAVPAPPPPPANVDPIAAAETADAAETLETAESAGDDDDDEPELEASDDDEDDELADETLEGAWAEAPVPWPYPTGGPPGLALPPRPASARAPGLGPGLSVGLLALGLTIAIAGTVRLAATMGGGTSLSSTATADPAEERLDRPRRRGSAPRPMNHAAPPPRPASTATPVTVAPPAAPEVEPPIPPVPPVESVEAPEPVVEAPEPATPRRRRASTRRRPRARPQPSAPSMAPSMAPRRTLVRDPGF